MPKVFYMLKLFLFILIFILYRTNSIKRGYNFKHFSKNSLCGGFLNDVVYDMNKDLCQLPCNVITTFHFIDGQKNNKCKNSSAYIAINRNMITSTSDVIVKQHKVVGMQYLIYNKYLYV